jgi:toxin HigB-1
MIVKFSNQYLQDLYQDKPVSGKPKFDNALIKKFKKVIQILKFAENSKQIYDFKGLHFEKLVGNMAGYYSCRVDIHYRLILSIETDAILVREVMIVEDLNNHYG